MPSIRPLYRMLLPALVLMTVIPPLLRAGMPTPDESASTPEVVAVVADESPSAGLPQLDPTLPAQAFALQEHGTIKPLSAQPPASASPSGDTEKATPATPPATSSATTEPTTYFAVASDTLSTIAQRFGTTAAALAQLNGITNPDRIAAGQKITLHGTSANAPRSLLQQYRLVTYYGVDGVPGLGVLGQLKPDELVRQLKDRAAALTAAGGKETLPALHLIVAQAMKEPQRDGTYVKRVDPKVIQRYIDLATKNGMQVILDHHVGNSSIVQEIAWLRPFLELPNVHLALDTEWATPKGVAPGSRMGSLSGQDISLAIQELAKIAQAKGIPNKVLLIHQFRASMITDRDKIVNNPAVDLVINMDGYGDQQEKTKWYHLLVGDLSTVYKGLQIFLRLDKSPFSIQQALALNPVPDVIVYL